MAVSDDDWFERALRESEGDSDEADDAPDPAGAEATEAEDPPADEGTAGGDPAGAGGDATGGSGAAAPDADEQPDGELFDDDFTSAFQGASGVPDTPPESPGAGGDGDEFGLGDPDGDGFSMGAPDSGGFDDEAVDSELPRVDLGIDGLDDMIRGGVPERSLMTVIGSAGTGKTTFGLQFLEHALRDGERAVYITLEESRERVLDSAAEKGWAFREYVDEGQLAVVDMDPVEMANSLASIQSELPRLIQSFDASRLVLDSVSLLEMMYEDRAKRRNEVYDFTRSIKDSGVTTLLTSEADDENPYTSRHGIVEYLTDAVFVMQYVRPSDFRETRLAIEIQKIRDASHSREMKPYEITDEGINVYRQANIF